MKYLVIFQMILMIVSCTKQSDIEIQMEEIRALSNNKPDTALAMYKTMRVGWKQLPRHAQMKYDLLGIRLNDKNDIEATSDSTIITLIDYYESHGNNRELQETYYYAGSVYRDLQDTPRSMDYFLKSAERAQFGDVDSLLLRNCFSQLSTIDFKVQDYKQALWAAKEECKTAETLGILDDLSLIHISNAHIRLHEDSLAADVMGSILSHQKAMSKELRDRNILYDLLYSYSVINDTTNAKVCHNLVRETGCDVDVTGGSLLAMANYNHLIGDIAKCTECYKQVMNMEDLENKYNASMELYLIYHNCGIRDSASKYAEKYLEFSTQLDLGHRQEQAATTNNMYRYYKNKMQEERLKADNERYLRSLYFGSVIALFLLASGLLLHYRGKYRRLRTLTSLTESLSKTRKLIASRERELEEAEKNLQEQKSLVHKRVDELTIVSLQLQKTEKELQEKNALLTEKMEQNRHLFMIQHQASLKRDAKEMLTTIKEMVEGKNGPESLDWDEFMTVIDTIHPGFNAEIYDRLGKLKPKQIQTCYLLKGGFTNAQIQNLIVGVSRATIWRWIKTYGDALADIINK